MCNQCDTQEYMFASRGPVSTMPGSVSAPPQGMMCDKHEDRPATKRIQGETDSFGCEYFGACDECYAEFCQQDGTYAGTCAWCKKHSDKLRETRDYDEGSHGPVYDVCPVCRKRQNDDAHAELEASGYFNNVHESGEDDPRHWEDQGDNDDGDDPAEEFSAPEQK